MFLGKTGDTLLRSTERKGQRIRGVIWSTESLSRTTALAYTVDNVFFSCATNNTTPNDREPKGSRGVIVPICPAPSRSTCFSHKKQGMKRCDEAVMKHGLSAILCMFASVKWYGKLRT
jgi:hypothetical protein